MDIKKTYVNRIAIHISLRKLNIASIYISVVYNR